MIELIKLRKYIMNYKEKPKPAHEHKDWYKQRNVQIYKDRHNGMTWRALGDKYDLSATYLRSVYESYKFQGGK